MYTVVLIWCIRIIWPNSFTYIILVISHFSNNTTLNFPGYLPSINYSTQVHDLHPFPRRCCCLLHPWTWCFPPMLLLSLLLLLIFLWLNMSPLHYSCSSPMQILQVYICYFGRNRKAPLGFIMPLKCNLFYPISPLWPSNHHSWPPSHMHTCSFGPKQHLLQMTSLQTPLKLILLQRSSLLYLVFNQPKAIAALLTALPRFHPGNRLPGLTIQI